MSQRSVGHKRRRRSGMKGSPRKRIPLASPDELANEARQMVKLGWFSRLSNDPPYHKAAEQIAEAAKKFRNGHEWNKAAEAFIEAAQLYEQANEDEKAIVERKSAAQTYYDSVCSSLLAEEVTLDEREEALEKGIAQLEIALAFSQKQGDFLSVHDIVEEIVKYFLSMNIRQYDKTAEVFFNAGEACGNNPNLVNQYLIQCTTCKILDNDPSARRSYQQIRINLRAPFLQGKGKAKIQWSNDCWLMYALCCVLFNIERIIESAPVCRQGCPQWDDVISLSERNAKTTLKTLKLLQAYVNKKEAGARAKLLELPEKGLGPLASQLLNRTIELFDEQPHPRDGIVLQSPDGQFRLKYILNPPEVP